MAQRALVTWSFDGLLPKRFQVVSERTHTPVNAIIIAFVHLDPAGSSGSAFSEQLLRGLRDHGAVRLRVARPVRDLGDGHQAAAARSVQGLAGGVAARRRRGASGRGLLLLVVGCIGDLPAVLLPHQGRHLRSTAIGDRSYYLVGMFVLATRVLVGDRAQRSGAPGHRPRSGVQGDSAGLMPRLRRSRDRAPAAGAHLLRDRHPRLGAMLRKFLNAGKFYDVQYLILGGDITGKTLVPIERAARRVAANYRDHQYADLDDDERAELEQRIRDNGQYPVTGERDELEASCTTRRSASRRSRQVVVAEHRSDGWTSRRTGWPARASAASSPPATTTSGRSTPRFEQSERGRVRRGPLHPARRPPRDDHHRATRTSRPGSRPASSTRPRCGERIEGDVRRGRGSGEPDRRAAPARRAEPTSTRPR